MVFTPVCSLQSAVCSLLKTPAEGGTFANHTRKHGVTLEPWAGWTSTRVKLSLRPAANRQPPELTRSRAITEPAPRRNPRPAECFSMLPGHSPGPGACARLRRASVRVQVVPQADSTIVRLPWASRSNRSCDLFVESVCSRRVVRESNPQQPVP